MEILEKMPHTGDLDPGRAMDLIRRSSTDLVILDVCTQAEFRDRHLENAINISFLSRAFKSSIDSLDRRKTYLVYCTVGGRSKMAARLMKNAGFPRVYNLTGGTLLWQEFEYPFARGAAKTHGFSVCPVLNSMLATRKAKKMVASAGSRMKAVMAGLCRGIVSGCRCDTLMPAAMAGGCGADNTGMCAGDGPAKKGE